MSSLDDYRWPVRAKNMATGAVRGFARAHHLAHSAWVVSMALYTLMGCGMALPAAGFIAWEVFFGAAWAALWGWAASEWTES